LYQSDQERRSRDHIIEGRRLIQMIQFIRRFSIKHHPTGDHYVLSIPRPVAEALGLHEDGGLVSIELFTNPTHKKGAILKAYWDSDFAWREQFDPAFEGNDIFKPMIITPRTLGPSNPFGSGKVRDIRLDIKELRAATRWLTAMFPSKRSRKPKRRRCIK